MNRFFLALLINQPNILYYIRKLFKQKEVAYLAYI